MIPFKKVEMLKSPPLIKKKKSKQNVFQTMQLLYKNFFHATR